ncbi:heme peroxidase [Byssothecium circinans]|uniref:Peroxidase n=1 Tax=Byssothecium circinans TaxID=147558 RepID=A0A6A5U425_9PLEO|nr:heme peroxidase [Byssothecium circinans]
MKLSSFTMALGAFTLIDGIIAHPGMGKALRDLEQHVKRADDRGDDPPVAIGDIKRGGKTKVGKAIHNILMKKESGQSREGNYFPPGNVGTARCKADTCCVWSYVSEVLSSLFQGPSGRCNKYARAAVRLGFHDAGTWSQPLANSGKDFGGADGSIILSGSEIKRGENKGLQDIVEALKDVQGQFNVGMADLIQFAANHAVVTCPLGPRVRTFIGRKDSSKPAPEGLLPGIHDSADKMIKLFRDKTISPHDLVALLGAHTTSQQFFVDKFPSDVVLSKDPRTADEWKSFSGKGGQGHWNEDWAYSYIRLSLLGVNNINDLTECTKVLPQPKPDFVGAGKLLMEE